MRGSCRVIGGQEWPREEWPQGRCRVVERRSHDRGEAPVQTENTVAERQFAEIPGDQWLTWAVE